MRQPTGLWHGGKRSPHYAAEKRDWPVRLFSVEGCQCRTAGQVDERLKDMAASIAPRPDAGRVPPRWFWSPWLRPWRAARDSAPMSSSSARQAEACHWARTFFERWLPSAESLMPRAGYAAMCLIPVIDSLSVFGCDAPVRIISNACASGSNALGIGRQLIRNVWHNGSSPGVMMRSPSWFSQALIASRHPPRRYAARSMPDAPPSRRRRRRHVLSRIGDADWQITGYGSAIDTHHLTQLTHPDVVRSRQC